MNSVLDKLNKIDTDLTTFREEINGKVDLLQAQFRQAQAVVSCPSPLLHAPLTSFNRISIAPSVLWILTFNASIRRTMNTTYVSPTPSMMGSDFFGKSVGPDRAPKNLAQIKALSLAELRMMIRAYTGWPTVSGLNKDQMATFLHHILGGDKISITLDRLPSDRLRERTEDG